MSAHWSLITALYEHPSLLRCLLFRLVADVDVYLIAGYHIAGAIIRDHLDRMRLKVDTTAGANRHKAIGKGSSAAGLHIRVFAGKAEPVLRAIDLDLLN